MSRSWIALYTQGTGVVKPALQSVSEMTPTFCYKLGFAEKVSTMLSFFNILVFHDALNLKQKY